MKIAAIILFVLAGMSFVAAAGNVFLGGPNRPERPEDFVGYAVGAFLLPTVFLIVGLVLWSKSKKTE